MRYGIWGVVVLPAVAYGLYRTSAPGSLTRLLSGGVLVVVGLTTAGVVLKGEPR